MPPAKLLSRMRFVTLTAVIVFIAACGAAPTTAPAPSTPAEATTTSSAPSAPAKPVDLTVGIASATSPTSLLIGTAQALGIAQKNGLNLKFVVVGLTATAAVLDSGQAEILAGPTIDQAILRGLDARLVAAATKPYWQFWGRPNSVGSWTDLNGRKLGAQGARGSPSDILFQTVLKQRGVDVSKVTFFYNGAPQNAGALISGAVDAAFVTPPFTYSFPQFGLRKVDLLTDINGRTIGTGFTMMSRTIKANPAVVERLITTLQETVALLETQPLDARVLPAQEKHLRDMGADPATMFLPQFMAELALGKTWQVMPTKALIAAGIELLQQLPEAKDVAGRAVFGDLVYVVPSLADRY